MSVNASPELKAESEALIDPLVIQARPGATPARVQAWPAGQALLAPIPRPLKVAIPWAGVARSETVIRPEGGGVGFPFWCPGLCNTKLWALFQAHTTLGQYLVPQVCEEAVHRICQVFRLQLGVCAVVCAQVLWLHMLSTPVLIGPFMIAFEILPWTGVRSNCGPSQ